MDYSILALTMLLELGLWYVGMFKNWDTTRSPVAPTKRRSSLQSIR